MTLSLAPTSKFRVLLFIRKSIRYFAFSEFSWTWQSTLKGCRMGKAGY
jgi:hypothetical protein